MASRGLLKTRYLNPILVSSAIFFCIKGLGGAFHSPLEAIGLIAVRSPIVGALIGFLIIAACWTFRPSHFPPLVVHQPSAKERNLFLFAFAILIYAAIFTRTRTMHQIPLDILRADMLPTVQMQIEDFLSGADPYEPQTVGERVIPRAYLPGIWLGYLPLQALGLDIRYLNLFAHLLLYFLLLDCFLRRGSYFGWRFNASATFFLFLVGMHVFSKQAMRELVDVQTAPFWISYSLFLWGTLREKKWVAVLAIPYLLVCRQPAVLLAIPYFVWLLKNDRARAWKTLAVTVGLVSIFLLPFYFRNPSGFLAATLWHLKLLSTVDFNGMARFYGLGCMFNYFHLESWQLPLQALGLAIACGLVWRRSESNPMASLAMGGLSYTWMMLLVPVTFPYVFAEPLILLFFLLQSPMPKTSN